MEHPNLQNLKSRFSLLALLSLLWLGTATIAVAETVTSTDFLSTRPSLSLSKTQDSLQQPKFLPVDVAFQFTASYDGKNELLLRWDIVPRYYLYRHGFSITTSTGRSLGSLNFPQGKPKTDEFFGDTEVYYRSVAIPVLLPAELVGPVNLRIGYQGCADAGICYPPETKSITLEPHQAGLTINLPGITPTPSLGTTANSPASQDILTEHGKLFAVLSNSSLLIAMGIFFIAGVGLAFTPCVMPMAPLLSAVIVGSDNSSSLRVALLSLTYVMTMAVSYTILGILVGLFGAQLNLQSYLQNPWFLSILAVIFVLLALSMFGLYELRLPRALQNRLNNLSSQQSGGSFRSAVLLGLLATVLVSPCISAPLAGALLYISNSSDPMLGGLALFSLAIGMGIPILMLGIGAGALLPKAGEWMLAIKVFFGVTLLGLAIYILDRVLPGPAILFLWGTLFICMSVYLNSFDFGSKLVGWRRLRQSVAIVWLVYGILLLLGSATGGTNPLQPLAVLQNLAKGSHPTAAATTTAHSPTELEQIMSTATATNQAVIVEFHADWCVSCKIMQRNVYPDPQVRQLLTGILWISIDMTSNAQWQLDMLRKYNLFGPPSLLFFDRTGVELKSYRIQGEVDLVAFTTYLQLLRAQQL